MCGGAVRSLIPMETYRTRVIVNAHALFANALKKQQQPSIACLGSTSSKCTYVLNRSSKGSSETAKKRRLALTFVAHALKTTVDCGSTSST